MRTLDDERVQIPPERYRNLDIYQAQVSYSPHFIPKRLIPTSLSLSLDGDLFLPIQMHRNNVNYKMFIAVNRNEVSGNL